MSRPSGGHVRRWRKSDSIPGPAGRDAAPARHDGDRQRLRVHEPAFLAWAEKTTRSARTARSTTSRRPSSERPWPPRRRPRELHISTARLLLLFSAKKLTPRVDQLRVQVAEKRSGTAAGTPS